MHTHTLAESTVQDFLPVHSSTVFSFVQDCNGQASATKNGTSRDFHFNLPKISSMPKGDWS